MRRATRHLSPVHSMLRFASWANMALCVAMLMVMGCREVETGLSEADKALGQHAFHEVERFVKAHPQRLAGVDSQAVAETLVQRLSHPQRVATKMPFETPLGTMVNVLYSAPKGVTPKLLLVSHFDSKRGIENFQSVNDGPSTTGLLIALANHTDWPIMCLFTDGEECVKRYSKTDGLHGSRQAAAQGVGGDLPVLVLDMLGDKDYDPLLASNASEALNAKIRIAAKAAGLTLAEFDTIIDDHLPFYDKGRTVANLIDLNYGPNNAYWHTAEDSLDKISATSLSKTIALIRYLLRELEK